MFSDTFTLAVQLCTLRSVDLPLPELFRRVAEIGYTGVETFMFGPPEIPADRLYALLEKHGLRVVSAGIALDEFERDLDGVIAYHKALHTDTFTVPWIPEERRAVDLDGWLEWGCTLDKLGSRCAGAGMRLLYHNHDYEMIVISGKTVLEWLLDTASPAHLGLEFDIAWAIKGDADAVALLHKYAGRCPRVHVRDLIETDHGLDGGDVGYGVLEWDPLLSAMRLADVECIVVEHDTTLTPLESIQRSYEYLHQRLGQESWN